ncbi:MAG: sulfur carrier protein [Candidatus Tokpelaia sp. JSC189]|nr:MAG: sulfur carrier protein [Candidatus Tokpelaia sp. JSC189]
MHIHVNGKERETKACFLAGILVEFGFEGDWLATAVNNEVVAANERADYRIYESDWIEIVSPMQGG